MSLARYVVSYEVVQGTIGPLIKHVTHIEADDSRSVFDQIQVEIAKIAARPFFIAEWYIESDEEDDIGLLIAPDWF